MVGERIRKLRAGEHMTQQELAARLNISKSAVSMYEQNQRSVPHEVLLRICSLFSVSTDFLLSRDEPKEELCQVLDNLRQQLLNQEGLMFHGELLDADDVEKIVEAMRLGAELARRRR